MCPPSPELPRALVEKYDRAGPRYTSYPTAPVWADDFGRPEWEQALATADAAGAEEPIAIYVHLPFCKRRCLFCACNVVIGRRDDVVVDYLDRL